MPSPTILAPLRALSSTPCAVWLLLGLSVFACQPQHAPAPKTATPQAQTPSGLMPWHQRLDRGKWVEPDHYVATAPGAGRFWLSGDGQAATLVVSSADYRGVIRATDDLRTTSSGLRASSLGWWVTRPLLGVANSC
ncbi:MAG TPA: hypothetical protein VKP30_24240 [Polyangiaceae bacterium]|nr:hypothetical protein [Polyangiaceae bacterium]